MNYKQLLIGKAYVGIDHLRQKGPNVTNLWEKHFKLHNTMSYDEIKQKVITQANDHHRVKAYTP